WLQRIDRRLRRPGQGGRARSDEGGAHCTDQRGLDRGADADDRSAGSGDPGREEGCSISRRPRRRHGRNVLRSCQLSVVSFQSDQKPCSREWGFFACGETEVSACPPNSVMRVTQQQPFACGQAVLASFAHWTAEGGCP